MIEIEGPDGVIYEFPEGTDDATMQKAMQQVYGAPQQAQPAGQGFGNNVAQAAGDGLFFGFGDEISARLNAMTGYDANTGTYGNWGTTYDDQLAAVRGQEKQFREDHPYVATGAEIGGAMIPAVAGVGAVGQAASLGGKVARGAAAGAAMGGLYGFGEGEGRAADRADNAIGSAVTGGLVGGAIPLAGSALGSLFRNRAQSKAIANAAKGAPTTEELRSMGNALYKQVDDAGVQIKPESFSALRESLLDRLRSGTGFDELPGPGSLTPNTGRVMQIMEQADNTLTGTPTAALPFKSLDQMRRQAGAAAGNVANKTDQAAGMSVIQGLDDFVEKLGPDDVVAGDPQALQSAITKAREVWGRMSKSQLVDDAMERSENYLSGSASGMRNQFKNILQNKKLAARFTAAERAAMRQVTHGGPLSQLVNLAGGGLAQMGTIATGAGLGGVPGAAAGAAVATGQRALQEALVARAAERARAAIASGALNRPEVAQQLAIAGKGSERALNHLLFGAAPQTANALQQLLQGQ
ncbi:hypothetical protein [Paracoccus aminovorans]|uniref:hypothetical protein n=1 Tax=Paracoccus aminovorans TaxID=34004 RepID=UPI000780F3CA|nr:hypothetical protein [Paracoccus aminovorans]